MRSDPGQAYRTRGGREWGCDGTRSGRRERVSGAGGERPQRGTRLTVAPEAEFASNLSRPDHVDFVCGTLERPLAKFSAVDAAQRQPMASTDGTTPPERSDTVTAALPLADRRLGRTSAFREHLAAIAHRQPHRPGPRRPDPTEF